MICKKTEISREIWGIIEEEGEVKVCHVIRQNAFVYPTAMSAVALLSMWMSPHIKLFSPYQ